MQPSPQPQDLLLIIQHTMCNTGLYNFRKVIIKSFRGPVFLNTVYVT